MNHCVAQQNNFAACEEIWGRSVEKKETVVCPKPRRLGLVHLGPSSYTRPFLRWHTSHQQQEDSDAKAGNELLDIIILAKGGLGTDQSISQLASSPPYFHGSPPSRVSNPLIQDPHFFDQEKPNISPRTKPSVPSSPSSSTRKAGGCVRAMSFGNNPAVRIEGFDCLNRDRRNCSSIPALA